MSPRILDLDHCRHCKAELARPTPRVCPTCGGSLQKRFLAFGCLTSAPPPLIAGWLVLALATGERGRAEPARPPDAAPSAPAPVPDGDEAPSEVAAAGRGTPPGPVEAIAMGRRHP